MYPTRQWDTSRLPRQSGVWDKTHMEPDADTPLARELRRLMTEKGIGAKALSVQAQAGDTYARDILKGRSKSPEAFKLVRVAAILGCPPEQLLNLVGKPNTSEVVSDPAELLLLTTWRQLSQESREAVREFIAFQTARSRDGKAV